MRLTKRDCAGNALKNCEDCEIKFRENCCSKQLCLNALINKLAAYEDAEEQGRLVILPCKVGTRIYFNPPKALAWLRNPLYEYEITNLIISCNKKNKWVKKYRAMQVINGKIVDSQINFEFYDIGKTVFLTREEAEISLKEGNKDA